MPLYGALGDPEFCRDRLAREPSGDEIEDLPFSVGQDLHQISPGPETGARDV